MIIGLWRCLVLLAVATAACSGTANRPITRPVIDTEVDPAWGVEGLARDLEATVLETYAQLGLGNIAAYAATLSQNLPVTLIGVEPYDVVTGVEPEAAHRDRRLYPRRATIMYSKILETHMAREHDLAWTFDEVSVRVPIESRWASIPIRVTFAFVREVDRWAIVMEHRSYALPVEEILERAGQLTTPRGLFPIKPEGEAGDAILATIAAIVEGADPELRREKLADHNGALLVLPGTNHEYHGKAIATAPTLSQIFGPAARAEIVQQRIFIAETGDAAWVAANLNVHSRFDDKPVRIGLRATYILELSEDNVWRVVQTHVSVPITEEDLSDRVFSGALDPPR